MLLALLGCTENHIVVQEEIDVFYQTPLQAVDVLMVVDNSCSMEPYQTMLSETFSEFVTWFVDAEVSWQIVVTTTDVDDPSIRAVIHSSDTDGGDVFAESVRALTKTRGLLSILVAAAEFEDVPVRRGDVQLFRTLFRTPFRTPFRNKGPFPQPGPARSGVLGQESFASGGLGVQLDLHC